MNNESVRERRRGRRFPIRLTIHYKVLQSSITLQGTGTTLDISTSGIAFTTQLEIVIGSFIEVAVDWPAMLDGVCAVQLVGSGLVVRSDSGRMAVAIGSYQLRTRGKTS